MARCHGQICKMTHAAPSSLHAHLPEGVRILRRVRYGGSGLAPPQLLGFPLLPLGFKLGHGVGHALLTAGKSGEGEKEHVSDRTRAALARHPAPFPSSLLTPPPSLAMLDDMRLQGGTHLRRARGAKNHQKKKQGHQSNSTATRPEPPVAAP